MASTIITKAITDNDFDEGGSVCQPTPTGNIPVVQGQVRTDEGIFSTEEFNTRIAHDPTYYSETPAA